MQIEDHSGSCIYICNAAGSPGGINSPYAHSAGSNRAASPQPTVVMQIAERAGTSKSLRAPSYFKVGCVFSFRGIVGFVKHSGTQAETHTGKSARGHLDHSMTLQEVGAAVCRRRATFRKSCLKSIQSRPPASVVPLFACLRRTNRSLSIEILIQGEISPSAR